MDEDELALVSSLYGKGTTLCWLLTIFACIISWICDKGKRKSDSLNSDFIGILALPSVAAGHILYQIRCLQNLSYSDMTPVRITQLSRAIEASLTVIKTFIVLGVVLFLVVFPARGYKRSVLIGLTGLFCLATEYVVYSQLTNSPKQQLRAITASFTRSFVSNSAIISVAGLSVMLACIAIAFCLALYLFYRAPSGPLNKDAEEIATFAGTMMEKDRSHTPEAILQQRGRHQIRHVLTGAGSMYLSFVIAGILTSSIGASNMSMYVAVHSLRVAKTEVSDLWSGLGYAAQKRFLAAFFPKTATGLSDLDQAVALATGCIILSLSLWRVGKNWYSNWKVEHEAKLREQRIEDIRLAELRRRLTALAQEGR